MEMDQTLHHTSNRLLKRQKHDHEMCDVIVVKPLTLLCEPCVMVEALNWAGLAALHATLSSSRKPRKKTSDTMT